MYKLDRAALVPLRTCTRDTAVSISYLAEVSGLPNSLAVDSSAGLQFFTKIFTDVPENYNIMPTVFISSATRHFFLLIPILLFVFISFSFDCHLLPIFRIDLQLFQNRLS